MPAAETLDGVAVVTGPDGPAATAAAAAILEARAYRLVTFGGAFADPPDGPDRRDPAAIDRALTEAAASTPLRVLVTCPPRRAARVATAAMDFAAMRTTLFDALELPAMWAQAAGRRMLASGGGVIVNIVHLSGLGGWPGWAAEAAAMAGLVNFTHTLAAEWAASDLRANTLVLGASDPAGPGAPSLAEGWDARTVRDRIPLGRFVAVDDIRAAIAYLIDPDSSYVNGEVLRVDGGWDAWGRLSLPGRKA